MKQDAERLLAGELSYLDYAAACAAEDARCADLVSDAPYWAMLQRARDEGKKIIYVSGPAPVELIYAFDCVPMSFDLLTPRLSENAALIPPLMRACELRANADVCRLSKAQIGTIPCASEADQDAALTAAALAFPLWSATPAWDRAATLRRAADHLRAHADDCARIMSTETGKPKSQTTKSSW